MAEFIAILTAAGAAALAAAQGGSPVPINQLAVGDANGIAYVPTGAEAALVNERQRVAVEFAGADPEEPGQLLLTGIVPVSGGGYTIREVGFFTQDGALFAIANFPPTYKPDAETEGGGAEFAIRLSMAIEGTPNVTVVISGASYATQDWARSAAHFFAVISATLTAPPGSPVTGAYYLVPAGASGVWAAQSGKIALWRGSAWLFITPPDGAVATVGLTGIQFRKTSTGWVSLADSLARNYYLGG